MTLSSPISADDADSPKQSVEIRHPNQLNQEDSVRSSISAFPQETFLTSSLTIRVPNRDGPCLVRSQSDTQDLKKLFPVLHCQVARLRKEDQQLTDDVTEVIDAPKERMLLHHVTSHVGEVFVSTPRPSTPSRLGMRTKSCSAVAWDSAALSQTSSSSSF